MRAAWEQGVILGGVSAGSLCWHVGGTTDPLVRSSSRHQTPLGFSALRHGVHYDAEAQPSSTAAELMKSEVLGPLRLRDG